MAALLAETGAGARSFQYRNVIGPALGAHVQALARELGFPTDIRRMTVQQQRTVLDRLDPFVRRRDPELWRTKQVSDFCAGIWAHVYGRSYNLLIKPFLVLHVAARLGLLLMLAWAALRWVRVRREVAMTARDVTHAFTVGQVTPHSHTDGDGVSGPSPSAPSRARARPAGARRRRA